MELMRSLTKVNRQVAKHEGEGRVEQRLAESGILVFEMGDSESPSGGSGSQAASSETSINRGTGKG